MPDGDIALDANGDLLFVGGDLQFVTGIDAVVADVKSRLLFFLGEDFLNVEGTGMPYRQSILGVKNPDLGAIRARIIQEIEGAPDVTAVLSLSLDFNSATRVLSGSWQAQTAVGTTPFIPLGVPVPTP